jgi:hypothetical protein
MQRKKPRSGRLTSEPALTDDTRQTALIIAMAVRNAMEDFHCQHLSDAHMRQLNPIIRNAICTALHALKNYSKSTKAREFINFNVLSIPDYWEKPELIAPFGEHASPGSGTRLKTSLQGPAITPSVYQLKVTLKYLKPPIWRRVQVLSDTTLFRLHQILQTVMGWTNSHLHQFIIRGAYYSLPDPEFGTAQDERRVRLGEVVSAPKRRFTYEYDFGDSWLHEILVEKIASPEPGVKYPVCLAGQRSCPPEDCGGVWGYREFLKAIQDPAHPEHESMLEWIGGSFDPEAFDVDAINRQLKRRSWNDPQGAESRR